MPTVQAATTARRRIALFSAAAILATLVAAPIGASAASPVTRFATFNASLNRGAAGQALTDLSAPGNAQADAVAEIIQRVRPEVLLINEFDFYAPTAAHPDGPLVDAFRDNYLDGRAQRRRGDRLPVLASSHRRTPASRAASTSTTTASPTRRPATTPTATTHWASACSRASSGWSCTRSTRS